MGKVFENEHMPETVFRNANLGKAVFDDVNLGEALFDNVNLANATIIHANLANLRIEDAHIRGLTIYGIRIDELIEAELDRRDPERVRVRMTDPLDPKNVQAVMQHLAGLRNGFIATLRAIDPLQVTTRPETDTWSALENVRHLLFAEQMYLDHWIHEQSNPLPDMGLLSHAVQHIPDYANVGSDPITDVETVVSAWEALHERILAFVMATNTEQLHEARKAFSGERTIGVIFKGMAEHQLQHIREAERAIKAVQST